MATIQIFSNQTANLIVQPNDEQGDPLVIVGVCKIDIEGVLDGAKMATQRLDETLGWVNLDEAVWDGSEVPPPELPASSYVNVMVHQIRFDISNAGASTDISVTLTYDP